MSFRSRLIGLSVVAVATFVGLPSADAQDLSGQIIGTVTDSSGGVLPGVLVRAEGSALIQPQTIATTGEGAYRFPSLPPGEYVVTFTLDGFQTLRREGIKLTLQ